MNPPKSTGGGNIVLGAVKLSALAGPLVLMFLLGFTPGISFIEDLGRHLLLGRIILETGSVPDTNLLTYTHPDFAFVNHHWLFQCGATLLFSWIGYNGLIAVKAVLMTVALGLSLCAGASTHLNSQQGREHCGISFSLLWVVGMLSALVLNYRAHIRPEVLSFLFVGLLLFLMGRHRKIPGGWPAAGIRILMTLMIPVWVNSHIYFMFGIGMLGAYGLERILLHPFRNRLLRETTWFGAAVVLCLMNPNGLDGLLYPFRILSNYGVDITENLSPFTLSKVAINPMLLALVPLWLIAAFSLAWMVAARDPLPGASRKRFWIRVSRLQAAELANAIILAAALVLSLMMARHTPLLALTAPPVVAAALNHRPRRKLLSQRATRALGVTLIAAAAVANLFLGWAVVEGSFSRRFAAPIAPTAFGLDASERYLNLRRLVDRYGIEGPVFSDFNIGSLVEYNIYPIPGYVDNRPEAFPMEFWIGEYHPSMESPERFKETVRSRGVNLVALSLWRERLPLPLNPSAEPEWALVLVDDFMAVWLLRTEANARAIADLEMTHARLEEKVRRVSEELLVLSDVPWWRRQTAAESVLFRLYGIARAGGGDLARPYLEQVVKLYPDYRMAREALRLAVVPVR